MFNMSSNSTSLVVDRVTAKGGGRGSDSSRVRTEPGHHRQDRKYVQRGRNEEARDFFTRIVKSACTEKR